MPRVAIVGTGRMGSAMAVRLGEAGADLVCHNRTRAKAEKVAERTRAAVADSPRDAAAGADVVVVSLSDDDVVRAAYEDGDGLAAGLGSDAVVLETSTVDPDTVRGLVPVVAKRGAVLLDAPVSGSVPLVEQGKLTFMAGGPAESLERVRPVLDVLAAQVFHVGEQGAGAVMKLAVNTVLYGLNQALSEGLVLAERAGVDRGAAYDVFAASAVAAPFVGYKRAAFERPDEAPAAFRLRLLAKDLDLIQRLGERVGVSAPQVGANRRAAREAVEAGAGDRDMSYLAEHLRRSI